LLILNSFLLLQHIASQKSLCQLCINLFPNCKWSSENPELQSLTSIVQFIGSFHLNSQRNKTRKQQQQIQQQVQQQVQFSVEIQQSFEQFKVTQKTSDELALLLIQLLTRCIDVEQEPQLSVTVHNFALGLLCNNAVDDANDEIIKFELLQLIAHCVNNFYINEHNSNALDFNSNFSQLLYALAASRGSSLLSHGILYLMFGTLHNLVENGAQQLALIDVKNFDSCFDVLQEAATSTTSTSLLFLHIYKLLLRLTDHLSRQEQQQHCLMDSSNSSAMGKQQPPRHKRQRHSQLHCTERSLSCYFQVLTHKKSKNFLVQVQILKKSG